MKVALPKKEEEAKKIEDEKIKDKLPEGDETEEGGETLEDVTEGVEEEEDESSSKISDRERKLELEKAKLEGQLEILNGKKNPSAAQSQKQAQLNQIYADLEMEDEDFKAKYSGYGKARVLQAVNSEMQAETSVKIARLEAKNSLARKYSDFPEFEDQIDDALNDASPAVLQDPDRLKKFMERTYQAVAKETEKKGKLPEPKLKSSKEQPVKKIVKDFHAPTIRADKEDDSEHQDEIKEEDRALAAKFGIRSETQRKKYMSSFIPMDLGGGVKFEDPKKGFEKVATK